MSNKGPATLTIVLIVVAVLVAGGIWYYVKSVSSPTQPVACTQEAKECPDGSYVGRTGFNCEFAACPNATTTSSTTSSTIAYRNTQYGFTFMLPASWKGYSILNSNWNGEIVAQPDRSGPVGPIITIRNPRWTQDNHYEDIPIMIFTIPQWHTVSSGTLSVSAAPFPPGELGQNNKYVFALPARYNYDFATGYQEVDALLRSNSLQTFNL